MGYQDLKIRDVSRLTGKWTPPIGAMGGPPAHELFRDLVLFADLQLFRDARNRPWVVLRDGAQRRAFSVPSAELRRALDRFRMRRNLRPVPEFDIEEFGRIVEAHISDPDAAIPTLQGPILEEILAADPVEPTPPRTSILGPEPEVAQNPSEEEVPAPSRMRLADEVDAMVRALEGGGAEEAAPPIPAEPERTRPRPKRLHPPSWVPPAAEPVDLSVSGGRALPPPDDALPRYVRVFQELVRDGGWMGTTRELAERTGDDPFTLFDSLIRFRAELADQGILVANVEVGDGFRWLAVDRSRIHDRGGAPAADLAEETDRGAGTPGIL